jgi:hypothetical protein
MTAVYPSGPAMYGANFQALHTCSLMRIAHTAGLDADTEKSLQTRVWDTAQNHCQRSFDRFSQCSLRVKVSQNLNRALYC